MVLTTQSKYQLIYPPCLNIIKKLATFNLIRRVY